jgi:hypothetical protein
MHWSVPLCTLQFAIDYEFFGPQMALAYQLDAISQGPKNSQFPGPNPLPFALIMDMHACYGCVHVGYLGKWEGVGPWKSRVFWAPSGTRLSARYHFTGPKKLSISRAQPPPTCPHNGPNVIKKSFITFPLLASMVTISASPRKQRCHTLHNIIIFLIFKL